jgi:hypothetical protein
MTKLLQLPVIAEDTAARHGGRNENPNTYEFDVFDF